MIRLENVSKISLQDVLKMSSRRLEDVFKKSWRCLAGVFARRLEDALKTSWRHLGKTPWRRLDDVLKMSSEDAWLRHIFVLIKTSWKRLLKTKTREVFKTFSKCLHQEECLLVNWSQIPYHILETQDLEKQIHYLI